MTILLFDSYTNIKQDLKTHIENNQIKIYGCGVTVYDNCHIGHGRVFVVYDVLIRFLKEAGYNVVSARNITDIDDKIIKRSQETNQSCSDLTETYTKSMHDDISNLNCLGVDHEPKATESIAHIIMIIEKLVEKGHAYVSDGEVFFSIDSFKHYGKLSGQKLQELNHGSRVEAQESKKAPGDFTLWKPSKEGEPSWDSPWGSGRPGWHIECSAMIDKIFNSNLDIHLGGADLKFPHHENEIAQSECCFDKPLSKVWMHIGFVQVKEEKMSKSLGNFVTLKDILSQHSTNTIRLFYLMTHYRQPLAFSSQALSQAKSTYDSLYQSLKFLAEQSPDEESQSTDQSYLIDLNQHLHDDLNFPNLIAQLFKELKGLSQLPELEKYRKGRLIKAYCERVMGLTFDFEKEKEQAPIPVRNLAEKRMILRQNKQWQEADLCRGEIESHGWEVLDTADGFNLVRKN